MSENKTSIERSKSYLAYLLIILIFVQILDTYATFCLNVVPSKIIEDFLLPEYDYNTAVSILSLYWGLATLGSLFVIVNQFIADRIGRKILLIITVFGMALMSLLITLSANIIQFVIFLFFLHMFFYADIWLIYINEEAPKEKRALWTNIILLFGSIGTILIPVFRSIFITESSPATAWRGMLLFSIILGFPLSIIILFTVKETSKYQEIKENRASVLESTKQFKKKMKIVLEPSRRNQYFVLLIMTIIRTLGFIFIALGETYISNSPYLKEGDINIVVYAIAAALILGYIITGILADKIGRLPLLYIYSALIPVAFILVIIGVNSPTNALLIVCIGMALGNVAYWGAWVVGSIVTFEILPTEARGTGNGLKNVLAAIGTTLGLLISSIFILFWGFGNTLILFGCLNLISIPLIYFYLEETKGIDLGMVK